MAMSTDFMPISIVLLSILVIVLIWYIAHKEFPMALCRHKGTYYVYEEDFKDGEHHTFRHSICVNCGKHVAVEQLQ